MKTCVLCKSETDRSEPCKVNGGGRAAICEKGTGCRTHPATDATKAKGDTSTGAKMGEKNLSVGTASTTQSTRGRPMKLMTKRGKL